MYTCNHRMYVLCGSLCQNVWARSLRAKTVNDIYLPVDVDPHLKVKIMCIFTIIVFFKDMIIFDYCSYFRTLLFSPIHNYSNTWLLFCFCSQDSFLHESKFCVAVSLAKLVDWYKMVYIYNFVTTYDIVSFNMGCVVVM